FFAIADWLRDTGEPGYGYIPAYLILMVSTLQLRMMSYTPSSATPNDAWARRTFSATRCSCVPENRAPAMSAPTTTSATIAMASAMPRSFFRTCFIPDSLRFTCDPPVSCTGWGAASPDRNADC